MNGPAVYELSSAPASWRIALPHTAAAVPVARALVRTALAELEHGADCDTAELLTAELVANAVEHTTGETPIELVVELMPSGCQVEVHDTDPAPPGGHDYSYWLVAWDIYGDPSDPVGPIIVTV